eukprot:TRINITY_DN3682_c0_g1_i1.p1 TRINITY_DN3682_c0_g1~~TRINITY_DN3682_c0_g1_i1.p1  ORF type:complete len:648 (+),score=227.62 TRINITY_DN3682_c0_g1_i1:102-2045(+)
MADDAAKKEEERLMRSMARATSSSRGIDLEKQKRLTQQRKAEREAKEKEAASKAKVEADKKRDEYLRQREAQQAKWKQQEEESKREEAEARAAAAASLESDKDEWKEKEAARINRRTANAVRAEDVVNTDDDESAAREEARMARLFGAATVQAAQPIKEDVIISPRSAAEREEERMSRHLFGKTISPRSTSAPKEESVAVKLMGGHSTAPSPDDKPSMMSPFEREVFKFLNLARVSPGYYADTLKPLIDCYEGKVLNLPQSKYGRPTKEGVDGLNEAIKYLESVKPVSHLTLSESLSMSSLDLVKDHGPKGMTGRDLSDGTGPEKRLVRYGTWKKKVAESMNYGPSAAKDIVDLWIIDDGDATRANRTRLFDDNMRVVGIASGPNEKYVRMCSVAWTCGFVDGATPQPEAVTVPTPEEAAAPAYSSTHDTSVIEESSDGKSFEIRSPPLKTTVDHLKLMLKDHGKLLHLLQHDGGTSGKDISNFRWALPFDAKPAQVHATLTANGGVTIQIKKFERDVAAAERILAEFTISPGSDADKFDLNVSESDSSFVFKTVPSKHKETVVVKLNGPVLSFSATHDIEEAEAVRRVTATRSISLPLDAAHLADDSIFKQRALDEVNGGLVLHVGKHASGGGGGDSVHIITIHTV